MSKKAVKIKPEAEASEGLKFETALSRLEKIVQSMETGELSLENALKQYEEGVGLARFCSQKLDEVQKKIEVLKKDSAEKWGREPFESPVEDNAGEGK